MDATDLKPSRLTLARFKVLDILNRTKDGQVGLIVFAGDAFVVSPLTDDVQTIAALVPVLTSDIMPAQGSRIARGLLAVAVGAVAWVLSRLSGLRVGFFEKNSNLDSYNFLPLFLIEKIFEIFDLVVLGYLFLIKAICFSAFFLNLKVPTTIE